MSRLKGLFPLPVDPCLANLGGIGNAKLAGFNKDLGLVNYDYNAVLSIFSVAYIIFESLVM